MSSGRDVMMDNWQEQIKATENNLKQSQELQWKMKQLRRMIDYRQTLNIEMNKLDNQIDALEYEINLLEVQQ